ncbi:MAG: hypothetical protein KC502_06605, partial [Myxococcales bacterium]|nr:hypothetical protein [Myxococcales bacterium]
SLLSAPTSLGNALLAPLTQRCRRDADARRQVVSAASLWFAQSGDRWQEHHGADARDGLMSTLVEQAVANADIDLACEAAFVWPPMRTALTRLAAVLTDQRRLADLNRLAQPYDRRSSLYGALVDTVTSTAESMGERGEPIAAWIFRQQPDKSAFLLTKKLTDSRLWAVRRAALVGVALDADDAPWIVEVLCDESDASAALSALIRSHDRRQRTVQSAMNALIERAPEVAFACACGQALLAVRGTTQGPLRRAVAAIRRAATALEEPDLASQWLTLLRREAEADNRLLGLVL